MKLAILTRDRSVPATQRLCEGAELRGHPVEVVPILHTSLFLGSEPASSAAISTQPPGEERRFLSKFDAVIGRVGTVFPQHALTLLRQFEGAGCIALNSSEALRCASHKIETLQCAQRHALPIPRSVLVKDLEQVAWAINAVGGAPVVIKPAQGLQGRRVVLAESLDAAISVVEAFLLFNQEVLIQEFIAEAEGADVRAWVLGDRVVAAMERRAPAGSFRSNVHRGGSVCEVTLSAEQERLALLATRAVGLAWAGVDLLQSERGALLLEVNGSPGFEGIERATNRDLAVEVIDYLVDQFDASEQGEASALGRDRLPRSEGPSPRDGSQSMGEPPR